jgi:hypothetical protein
MVPGLPVVGDVASTMLFNGYQAEQQAIARRVSLAIGVMWTQMVNPDSFSNSWRSLGPIVEGIIDTHYQMSAASAAKYYGMSRTIAGLYGIVVPGSNIAQSYISHVTNVMGNGQFYHHLKTHDAATSSVMAKDALSGAGVRLVLNGGRGTVIQAASSDADALGWERIIEDKPCSYCSRLAASTGIHKEASNFHAHDDCQCLARVVFQGQHSANTDLASDWQRVTAGKTGKAAESAWNKYWSNHDNAIAIEAANAGPGSAAPSEPAQEEAGNAAVA